MLKRKNLQEQFDLWGGIDPAEQANTTRWQSCNTDAAKQEGGGRRQVVVTRGPVVFKDWVLLSRLPLEKPALNTAECPWRLGSPRRESALFVRFKGSVLWAGAFADHTRQEGGPMAADQEVTVCWSPWNSVFGEKFLQISPTCHLLHDGAGEFHTANTHTHTWHVTTCRCICSNVPKLFYNYYWLDILLSRWNRLWGTWDVKLM